MMDKEVFNQNAEAAAFYNENYIVAKFDAEKGQGIEVAMKFHIRAYPTVIVLNSDMQLVTKIVGYGGARNFIEQCNSAMTQPPVAAVSGKSLAVELPDFYKQLYSKQGWADSTIVQAWLDKQTDLYSESCWAMLCTFPLTSRYMQHFLTNMDRYATKFGKADVEMIASGHVFQLLNQAKAMQSEAILQQALELSEQAMVKPDEYRFYILQDYYVSTKNWKKAVSVVEDLRASGKLTNGSAVNQFAWMLYQNCNDTECLKKVGEWMKGVIDAEPVPAYIDTYAALLYKTGQYVEAETYAKLAIRKGKEQGDTMTETEELLQAILKAKGEN